MPIEVFFDTNVVAYMFSSDPAKSNRSEQLLRDGGVISVQVLNELSRVARGKMQKTWPEVRTTLAEVRIHCAVAPLTIDVHERGIGYAERFRLNLFDAMFVSAAVRARCTTFFSEDMHDGLVIDGLTIRNPYLPSP